MSLLHAKATTLERAQRKFRERGDISDAQGMDGDYLDFAEALSDIRDQMAFSSPAVAGQLVTGRILTVDDKGATLDFGGKMPAYLPEVTGEVLGFVRGVPIVSLRGIQLEEAWDRVAELARKELSFDVTILDVNEGGAIAEFHGLQCFLPGSQAIGALDASSVGANVTVKVLDFSEEEGRLLVSQRKLAAANAPPLVRGAVVRAKVTGLRNYGVFLELDHGMNGLLHLSQISHERVESLEKLFRVGQEVTAMVLDVDKGAGKIALSTRALELVPGDMLRDPAQVYARASEAAAAHMATAESERRTREAATKQIASELATSDAGREALSSVTASIESILAAIVDSSK
eukprot:gene13256-9497_t